jgi:glycosyltransferase involved in cell wall biosynthesis
MITVLMSVFNNAAYLREAIDSILNQGFTDFEFLIIDDASTDSSKEIILHYHDTRIRLIENERNIGLTKSLNKGLREAKGEYIARMDADDISLPDRLAAQHAFLQQNPDVGVVSSWVQVIDEQGNNLRYWSTPLSAEAIYYKLNFRNCLAHAAAMFRKEIVLAQGGYNENIAHAQDYELWFRLSKMTKICQLDRVLLKWRDCKTNISSKWKNEQENIVKTLRLPGLESLAGMPISETDFVLLQQNEIGDFKELKRALFLLDKINRGLLANESHIIKRIGLDNKRLLKAMETGTRQRLYFFFRNLKTGKFLYYFMLLTLRAKFMLVKEIFSRIKRKLVHEKEHEE